MISRALRQLAEPSDRADRVKCAIDRASKLAGLSYWRTFDLWYRRGVLKPHERQQILDALARKQQAEARHELARLRSRLAALERQLKDYDADLDRQTPDLFQWARR
jgi:ABC-type phosphate transport system auxiliary subunit